MILLVNLIQPTDALKASSAWVEMIDPVLILPPLIWRHQLQESAPSEPTAPLVPLISLHARPDSTTMLTKLRSANAVLPGTTASEVPSTSKSVMLGTIAQLNLKPRLPLMVTRETSAQLSTSVLKVLVRHSNAVMVTDNSKPHKKNVTPALKDTSAEEERPKSAQPTITVMETHRSPTEDSVPMEPTLMAKTRASLVITIVLTAPRLSSAQLEE